MNRKLTNDSRVVELVQCVLFAVNNFKNRPIMDGEGNMMTWHGWFKKAIEGAGFKLKEGGHVEPESKGDRQA